MINRTDIIAKLQELLGAFPITAILGPRQCGKTTLARQLKGDHYFDLENPRDFSRLSDPQLTLEDLSGTIVIDEIQRFPQLFPLLRYMVDSRSDQKYLILGSASRDLIKQGSETLAGRIAFYQLNGFSLDEAGAKNSKKLWLRGGFPRSYLADSDRLSGLWLDNYITTFLERDIPQLGISIPAQTLRRFWMMLSHYHGQTLNYSELARSFGISDMTSRKYVEILEATFMVRLLQPWFNNTSKRLVKSPKLYLRDSGIFHALMGIDNYDALLTTPKLGASWEGFALEQVARHLNKKSQELFFWGTHAGAELDLFFIDQGRNYGIEFKYHSAPAITRSMKSAISDLSLAHLWVVTPGSEKYRLAENITVVPLHGLCLP